MSLGAASVAELDSIVLVSRQQAYQTGQPQRDSTQSTSFTPLSHNVQPKASSS